jgi:hypothetical protein
MGGQRGSLTLFNDIFVAEETPVLTVQRKGRSPELISKRNECLVSRYYFLGKFTDNRYNKILDTLEDEFFISTVTIPEIITENYELLVELKQKQPNRDYFKKKWPHLVW